MSYVTKAAKPLALAGVCLVATTTTSTTPSSTGSPKEARPAARRATTKYALTSPRGIFAVGSPVGPTPW